MTALHFTNPERWFKLQRQKATTQAEMDNLIRIYNHWKDIPIQEKHPFVINLPHNEYLKRNVYFTGFKTDGANLFVEYQIYKNSPKFTQILT